MIIDSESMKEGLILTKKSHVKCEEGLTLIEVLASLVILGIVFIGFMNIFPQMTVFNEKTETKLDTMNLARQEIVEIKSYKLSDPLTFEQVSKFIPIARKISREDSEDIEIEYEKSDYKYRVIINKDNALKDEEGLPSIKANNIGLYQVHVQMFTDGEQMSSETYGYLELLNKKVSSGN